MRVAVWGLDGTRVTTSHDFEVLSAPPTVRFVRAPTEAVVGEPVRVVFDVSKGLAELARVSTRSGIVFERRFLIREGRGFITWTPTKAGPAKLLLRVRGHQGQLATKELPIAVAASHAPETPPTVTLGSVPAELVVGRAATFTFVADGCTTAVARIEGTSQHDSTWRFPCPQRRATFDWSPPSPGEYQFTVIARGTDTSAQISMRLSVGRP
jgi:hypothetical protein